MTIASTTERIISAPERVGGADEFYQVQTLWQNI